MAITCMLQRARIIPLVFRVTDRAGIMIEGAMTFLRREFWKEGRRMEGGRTDGWMKGRRKGRRLMAD
jgi:hypothetical protein